MVSDVSFKWLILGTFCMEILGETMVAESVKLAMGSCCFIDRMVSLKQHQKEFFKGQVLVLWS